MNATPVPANHNRSTQSAARTDSIDHAAIEALFDRLRANARTDGWELDEIAALVIAEPTPTGVADAARSIMDADDYDALIDRHGLDIAVPPRLSYYPPS